MKKLVAVFTAVLVLGFVRQAMAEPPTPGVIRQQNLWLLAVVKEGRIDVVRFLIEKGADVNAKGQHGRTALMYAITKGHIDIASLLIKKGADVNAKDDLGYEPIELAAKGHIDIARLLIKKGADVNAQMALMFAAADGHADIARLFIEKGADVNAKDDKYGMTALMYAAKQRQDDIRTVRLLIKKGADVNAKNSWGFTALMFATIHTTTSIASLLIEKGADVNARDKDGRTALSMSKGYYERWTELLRK